jgi:hypothetical protein
MTSLDGNTGRDDHVITFASDKHCGLVDLDQRNRESKRHFSLPEVLYAGNVAEQPLRNQIWLVAKC